MTAVAEPKARKKAAKKVLYEGPNHTFVTTAEDQSVPAPPAEPGEPGYDWTPDYPGEDVFVYTALDGKRTVGLAAVGPDRKFKPGEVRKARHLSEMDQMFLVVERVASPNALAVSDEFDDKDYGRMFEQWSEWAKTSAGES